jgi:hypothetical protein
VENFLERFNVLLVRYSEIGLKSAKVRDRLEHHLLDQVKYTMRKEGVSMESMTRMGSRLIFIFPPPELPKAIHVMQYVIGVHSFSPGFACDSDFEVVKATAVEFALWWFQSGDTFVVRARHSKPYPKGTPEIEQEIGSAIYLACEAHGLKIGVDLHNPKKTIYIEIREKSAYILSQIIPSLWGGNPIEPDKPLLCPWSGHPLDIVASHLLLRRGAVVIPVLFDGISIPLIKDKFTENLQNWDNDRIQISLQTLARYFPDPLPVIRIDLSSLTEVYSEFVRNYDVMLDIKEFVVFCIHYHVLVKLLVELNDRTTQGIRFMACHLQFRGIISRTRAEETMKFSATQTYPVLHLAPLSGLSAETLEVLYSKLTNRTSTRSILEIINNPAPPDFSLGEMLDPTITLQKQSPNKIIESKIAVAENIPHNLFDHIRTTLNSPENEKIIHEIIQNARREYIHGSIIEKL